MFKKIKDRVVMFFKEIGNVATNFLIPLLGLIIIVVEVLPVPNKYINFLKVVEYWLFYAAGTAEKINTDIRNKYQNK
jgi:hypothetical protein